MTAAMENPASLRKCSTKPRVFIVSDISNEPDDAQSLTRYLLYSNEFDTRGLVACTSTWMKSVVHPEDMRKIINAYGKVVDNLNAHTHPENPYPTAESLLDLIKTGPSVYGKQALVDGCPLSEGAALLVEQLQDSDQPLWVLCWGGTNVLAQSLQFIQRNKSGEEGKTVRSRLRVYAISDQDDTGLWIRQTWPDIFYIASVHGWNQYGLAAWTGISGEGYYGFDDGGPDGEKVSREWIRENIQIGLLGSAYPDAMFIPEGDTPTFLYLIQNGLGSPENPNWGSWGGRYCRTDATGGSMHYSDAVDRVTGKSGRTYVSNHATIWRWRDAFQNDFAARTKWTLSPRRNEANHAPVAHVNGSSGGPEFVFMEAEAGSSIVLDASESYDPDGDPITFRWTHYKDITATQWWVDAEVTTCIFDDLDAARPGSKVEVALPPAEKCAVDMFSGQAQPLGQIFHFILEVRDCGVPALTTYKRIVVQSTNRELRGSRPKVDAIADAM